MAMSRRAGISLLCLALAIAAATGVDAQRGGGFDPFSPAGPGAGGGLPFGGGTFFGPGLPGGKNRPPLDCKYPCTASPSCLRLLAHCVVRADSRTDCTPCNVSPANMAMIATTTSNSTNVKPPQRRATVPPFAEIVPCGTLRQTNPHSWLPNDYSSSIIWFD